MAENRDEGTHREPFNKLEVGSLDWTEGHDVYVERCGEDGFLADFAHLNFIGDCSVYRVCLLTPAELRELAGFFDECAAVMEAAQMDKGVLKEMGDETWGIGS